MLMWWGWIYLVLDTLWCMGVSMATSWQEVQSIECARVTALGLEKCLFVEVKMKPFYFKTISFHLYPVHLMQCDDAMEKRPFIIRASEQRRGFGTFCFMKFHLEKAEISWQAGQSSGSSVKKR